MSNHDGKLDGYHTPTDAELKARGRRNIAIGLALAAFMAFIFIMMLTRMGGSAG